MFTSITRRSHKALLSLLAVAGVSSLAPTPLRAQNNNGITTVFYILLENRCWTSGTDKSQSNILFNNVNGGAPYLTALATPGSTAYTVTYQGQTISQTAHSSYCSCYHNVFGNATGSNTTPYLVENETANVPNGTSVHPSEPNYVFMEAGSNLSKLDDNDPYFSGASVQQIANFLAANPSFSPQNFSALLQNAGVTWTSYTEGTGLLNTSGQDFNFSGGTLTNNIAPLGTRTVPLVSFSGPSSVSFTITAGSATATTAASTSNIHAGQFVTGNFIPVGTTVLSVTSNSITMSSAPTALANTTSATGTTGVALSGSKTEGLLISAYQNAYHGTTQYNFATKHTGQLFFPATNGSGVASTAANQSSTNPMVSHYQPLEQFASDLANNTQAQYCVITPDQYNDGHTALTNTFVYQNYGGTNSGVTNYYEGGSDLARVGQMDSFCAKMVPQIMSSPVYQAGHAAIVIWTDETEGSPQNDFYHTLLEIVISPLSKGNGYNSTVNMTHSSDLATMQEIFGVAANTPTGYLNDAANPSIPTPAGTTVTVNTGANGLQTSGVGQPFPGFGSSIAQDMSDLFQPGVIPQGIPSLSYTQSAYSYNRRTGIYSQTVVVTNQASAAINGPIYCLATNMTGGTLANSAGTSSTFYAGSPYVLVSPSGLAAGASAVVTLQFSSTTGAIVNLLELVNTPSGTP